MTVQDNGNHGAAPVSADADSVWARASAQRTTASSTGERGDRAEESRCTR
jgi:hypothetical protein